jgi:hypothetical protein
MVLVAMNATFALLEINRVVGKIPMHDGMAIGVEVEALLPHGCAHEHEGPERRVERCTQLTRSRRPAAIIDPSTLVVAESRGKCGS